MSHKILLAGGPHHGQTVELEKLPPDGVIRLLAQVDIGWLFGPQEPGGKSVVAEYHISSDEPAKAMCTRVSGG